MRERSDVANKREECRMALRALKEALTALESLPADLISRINAAGDCPYSPRLTCSQRRLLLHHSMTHAPCTGLPASHLFYSLYILPSLALAASTHHGRYLLRFAHPEPCTRHRCARGRTHAAPPGFGQYLPVCGSFQQRRACAHVLLWRHRLWRRS